MPIFPENLATFEQKKNLLKNLEDIFTKLIQTLTSEVRVLNPKACGVQGHIPSGGCGGRSSPNIKKLC